MCNQNQGVLFAFIIKPKKHAAGYLSACFFIAIELNKRSRMSLWLTTAQTLVGTIGEAYVQTLDQPPFKFFWFFSRKKRTIKALLKLTLKPVKSPLFHNLFIILIRGVEIEIAAESVDLALFGVLPHTELLAVLLLVPGRLFG